MCRKPEYRVARRTCVSQDDPLQWTELSMGSQGSRFAQNLPNDVIANNLILSCWVVGVATWASSERQHHIGYNMEEDAFGYQRQPYKMGHVGNLVEAGDYRRADCWR